jgi:hypothetical protein
MRADESFYGNPNELSESAKGKYCVDCVHHSYEPAVAGNPEERIYSIAERHICNRKGPSFISNITGETIYENIDTSCHDQRHGTGKYHCEEGGKYFVRKQVDEKGSLK